MPQRDYLKDQIEQMAKVLGMILAKIMGTKTEISVHEQILQTDEHLKESLDTNLDDLLNVPNNQLKDYFGARKFNHLHYTLLSEILFELARNERKEGLEGDRLKIEKALLLLDLADEDSNSVSLDRMALQKKMESFLN